MWTRVAAAPNHKHGEPTNQETGPGFRLRSDAPKSRRLPYGPYSAAENPASGLSHSVLVGALNRVAIQPLPHFRPSVEHPPAVLDDLRTSALVAILGEIDATYDKLGFGTAAARAQFANWFA